ncbi:MAG TPA: hypothetical protein VFZ53_21285 [Polyangiaceae bacterium]
MGKKNEKSRAKAEARSVPPSSASRTSSVRPPPPVKTLPVPHAPSASPRRFGSRGAAPWAVRHAEKRAAEAAARLREPLRPGSARATLRTPEQAERIKARIGELHSVLGRVRSLRKNLAENFFELARALRHIADERLFDAKGYATFEAFVEREIDLGKVVALRLARIPELFQERAAKEHGVDAVLAAVGALETAAKPQVKRAPGTQRGGLPLKPPK